VKVVEYLDTIHGFHTFPEIADTCKIAASLWRRSHKSWPHQIWLERAFKGAK
jgi:hypothetical protein